MASTVKSAADPLLQPQIQIPPSPQLHSLPNPQSQSQSQNYVVLPFPFLYCPLRRCRKGKSLSVLVSVVVFLSVSVSVYALWPSDPTLTIVRLKLLNLKVHAFPHLTVDVSLAVTLKVRNRDAYAVDLRDVDVAVAYRGRDLGHVTSKGGHVKAWRTSYVEALAEFNGVEVISDWAGLLDDLAKGTVPFDTVSTVNGRLGLFFLEMPLKAKVTCEIDVNVRNLTITRESCSL